MNSTSRWIAAAAFSIVAASAAGPLSQGERDRAMSHLHANRKQLLDAIAGLSAAQWNFKPGPDRWSIAEIAEHLTVTENFIPAMVDKVTQGPRKEPAAASPQEIAKMDQMVQQGVADRSQKFQAPEPIKPTGQWNTPEDLAAEFKKRRDRNIEFLQKTEIPLREYSARHPVLGDLDAYRWYLLVAGHTDRHLAQLAEVKAAPGYPKK